MISSPPDEAITAFPSPASIDSCSITNLFSSKSLTAAALRRNIHFIVTHFVRYECLDRPRKKDDPIDQRLMALFRSQLTKGIHFREMSLDVDDLREIAKAPGIRQLGVGELSALVLARKIRASFVTEDRGARKLAAKVYPDVQVRTTSHLVGWLVYVSELSDGDITTIIAENGAQRGANNIGIYISKCYEHAHMLRLKQRS